MLLGLVKVCTAQIPAPLTQAQLLKLQGLSMAQITNYLSKQGWQVEKNQPNQLEEYFNYSLGYNTDRWEPANKSEWVGTLYVYYRKGYPNLLVYQTNQESFNTIKPTYIEPVKESNVEISIVIRYGLTIEFRNYFNDNSPKKYSILCYNIGSVKDLISKEKRIAKQPKKEEEKTDESKNTVETAASAVKGRTQNYQYYLQVGNTFFDQQDFGKALYHYQMAKSFLWPGEKLRLEDLDSRIAETRRQMGLIESEGFKKAAETFLKERKYDEALLNYQKAFQLNPNGKELQERISCLEEVTRTNDKDSLTLYRQINPKEFQEFRDLNTRALNYLMNSEKNNGYLNYAIHIRFDSKGKNLSSLKINSISDDRLIFYLTDISASYIPISLIDFKCISQKIPVASQDVISYDLKWTSNLLQAKAGKEIEFYDGAFTSVSRDSMIAFIKRQPGKSGIYTFQLLDKNLNGKKLQDVSLISYRNKRLSGTMFVPGLSDLKTGEVHRGKIKLTAFLLSAVLSIGSKIYADQQYQKYQAPENGQNIKYYNHANMANKVFLISGGVAAAIYLYDITSFIMGKSGSKNRSLKSELKNGPIPITENAF
jgi:tetratricopeptide (TPR) repeat protein